jgi:hypothetical protein
MANKPANESAKTLNTKVASLCSELEDVSEDALAAGEASVYAALHPVLVALSSAKVAAAQALLTVSAGDSVKLLERIKAL